MTQPPPTAANLRLRRATASILAASGTMLLLIALLLLIETWRFGGSDQQLNQQIACFWVLPAGLAAVLLSATVACRINGGTQRGTALLVGLGGLAAAVGITLWLWPRAAGMAELLIFLAPWWLCALLSGVLGACLWQPPAPQGRQ
jgi:hypothetical protein